jgi:hypothetical protein
VTLMKLFRPLTIPRLRATGVVDVENPVAQAAREGRLDQGRIEELDDDSPD